MQQTATRQSFNVATQQKTEIINITSQVQQAIATTGITEGACTIYVPHTTAAILIQENADPNVHVDLLNALDRLVPKDLPYLHQTTNKNAPSHIKAALIGPSKTVFIGSGNLLLGTYQFIYLCEFDGSRDRTVWLRIVSDLAV
ncbi:secondary thiamine-phosphate synthase enzyme YjbQ [Thermocoleostomius sinensis]|uniref:Secondary thiamine-phosphate synthase enzyme YjbQ n=1 Tax=Thermocoleostomius sinensis A174 TaxID=2016057 RepID=A0A9E9CBI3_9CYAN|nr:secondary thiamine-phosphate synthase enzyme YjbQ [Thermocoleostomius sinensis]WAL60605.1 secondary thiamine-phosphate synthase enzyme YjbQ [Thermocoleostomius sinensis A174]